MGDFPILVTGAAGFVGGHLLDLLEESGTGGGRVAPARARRSPLRRPARASAGTSWTSSTLAPSALPSPVCARAWSTISQAPPTPGSRGTVPRSTLQVNVLGTHNLLAALAAAGGPVRVSDPGLGARVRAAGSGPERVGPAGTAQSRTALSKLAQEMCGLLPAAVVGLEALVTRSFNHIGPRQDPSFFAAGFALQIARIEQEHDEPVLRVGNLDARRDLTDVRDTVRAYAALMARGRPGLVYNVCSGTAYRVGDILDGLLARARVPIRVEPDAGRLRPHDAAIVLGDRSRITADTGWAPAVPLDRTLDDLLAYWRYVVRNMSPA